VTGSWCSLCLCALIALLPLIEGAYFYVSEGTDKCFVENVPNKVPLTVGYNNLDNPGVMCSIVYKDPSGRTVYSKEVPHDTPSGKVAYLTKTAGEYGICVSCLPSKWLSTSLLKWSISIELGDTELNLEDAAKREEMTELERKGKQLLSRLEAISAENDYERLQELHFRETSDSINSRVVLFSAVQIALLSLTTILSIYHLTKFFHSQKLI